VSTKISVRLDNETRQLLEDLKLRLGWSYSKIIRESILLLAAEQAFPGAMNKKLKTSCIELTPKSAQ
jgi:hypothetical protein